MDAQRGREQPVAVARRNANFVLGTFADGIPVPLERFEAVQHWMDRNT